MTGIMGNDTTLTTTVNGLTEVTSKTGVSTAYEHDALGG